MENIYNTIIKDLRRLNKEEQKELVSQIISEIYKGDSCEKFEEVSLNNTRCPHCHSNEIKKNGLSNNKTEQRFYCKHCRKRFSLKTNTIFENSKKSIDLWYQFIDLMTMKMTLRYISKKLNINTKTAFLWRHKVLSAIKSIKTEKLTGLVEADETYLRENQKGSRHLTRPKHTCGKTKLTKNQFCGYLCMTEEEYKQSNKKRGLSNDQVCVLTALNRANNVFGKPVGYGKVTPAWIKKEFSKVISKQSTLITDGEKGYNTLQVTNHKVLKGGISKSKVYNLGRTDNLHTSIKGLVNCEFRGVATKYLDNYVIYVNTLKKKLDIFETVINQNNVFKFRDLKNKVAF